jgi:hypothetical protein
MGCLERCRSLRSRKEATSYTVLREQIYFQKLWGRDEWLVYYFPEFDRSQEAPKENESRLFFFSKHEGGPIVEESILPVYCFAKLPVYCFPKRR